MNENLRKCLKLIAFAIFLLVMPFLCFFPFHVAFAKGFEAEDVSLEENQRILTVVMYHQILQHGAKSRYIVTPKQLQDDLAEFLKQGFQTVLPTEVLYFVEFGGEFPEKPLILTFDDGHYNNLYYAKPILEKLNCTAVLNIIGGFSEYSTASGDHSNVNYSHMTWAQVKEADASGIFEIGNHTYNLHKLSPRKGVMQKKGESNNSYVEEISADILRLQKKLQEECQLSPICFAYPFGVFNKLTQSTLKDLGFKLIFNCFERRNLISTGDTQCLLNLCRFNRESSYSSKALINKIEKTKVL